jgi:putative flippase GtrA
VSGIRKLYERFRQLIHEGAKFLVIGGIGTIVTFGVANGLRDIGKYKAVTIATILATIVTYLGNRYWTFRHRENQSTSRETVTFLVLNGIGLLIYYSCIWLIQDAAGLTATVWYNVALVVGTGLGTLFRFWSYRKWVWRATAGGPPVVEPGPLAVEVLEEDMAGAAQAVGRDPIGRAPIGRQPVNGRPPERTTVGRAPGAHRRT